MKRRPALQALVASAATALLLAHGPAAADGPPIKILVGFPAGGSSDAIARHLALSRGLHCSGEQVIVAEEFAKAGVPTGGHNDTFGIQMLGNTLLHGQETEAWGDAGYQGSGKRPDAKDSVRWNIAMRPGTRKLLDNIVGVRLQIRRMQGKWKVSQNRSEADRLGVADGLQASGGTAEMQAMAALVRDPPRAE